MLVAADADLRLVDAAKSDDKQTVRSLLKQNVNVNQAQADGATALAWAAYHDDAELADLLIRAGASLNVANDYGVTPLSLACSNASRAMVELLLKAKADPNTATGTGETALMTCARRGSVSAVQLLLTGGADINATGNRHGQTALMWAAAQNHHEVVRLLIKHGADVQAKTKRAEPWQFKTYMGGVQDVAQGAYTALLFAVQQNAAEAVQVLLDSGAKLNEAGADGMTPLLLAVASGHEQLAISLVEKGADPKAADQNGVTPLHYAVQRGLAIVSGVRGIGDQRNREALAAALLAHGADPNARFMHPPLRMRLNGNPYFGPEGTTPFLLAAASNDLPLMRILLAAGANPNLKTYDNTTALMLSAGMAIRAQRRPGKEQEKNILDSVKLLIELGNDVNAVNTNEDRMINGKTALHAATYLGVDSVIQFLVEKGANVAAADRCGETPLNIALGDPAQVRYRNERIPSGYTSTAELLRKLGGDVPLPVAEVPCTKFGGVIHNRYNYTDQMDIRVDAAKAGAKE